MSCHQILNSLFVKKEVISPQITEPEKVIKAIRYTLELSHVSTFSLDDVLYIE